jgi:hypothetical protein
MQGIAVETRFVTEAYTWHHHQDVGRMQLVPRKIHADTGHVGGFDMWYGN